MNKDTLRILVLILAILACCRVEAQVAVQGQADLSSFDPDKDGPAYLYGTWEFYWNKLLTPADFGKPLQPEWVSVPGSWHRQGDYDVLGFATYRLRVKLPEKQHGLSLHFPVVNAAAKIWVNGELSAEIGKVAASAENYRPQLSGTVVTLPDHIRDLEIVVQLANYTYFSGGLPRSPQLDKTASTFARIDRMHGIENFFAGSLVAMFIYQVILYFLYKRGKPYLWLSLICLGVALRALIVHGGSLLLPNLFPEVSWEYWKKIEFGSIYAVVAFFPLYVYHLFAGHAPKKPVYFFVVLAALLFASVLVTPQYVYGGLLDICHVALILSFIYAVYSIGKAWRAGNSDARVILFGVLASFPFILAEILQNSAVFSVNIGFRYLVEMGVLVFLLFQVYLLANHYVKSYKNLELMNQNLEKMVEERTGELRMANKVKDRLLSVVSHDIKSPLNSLRGILQVYNKGAISRDEFDHFSQHIENDLNKTSMLVENILYWTASQLKGIQINQERFDLALLIGENTGLFRTIAANKNVTLTQEVPAPFMITSDPNILNLVLRNLIANAIKFSHAGGNVSVVATRTGNALMIRVSDEGVGMDEETLRSLQDAEPAMSTSGTINERGTGLGLTLCREYLQRAGGQLGIESSKGKGSAFSIILPA